MENRKQAYGEIKAQVRPQNFFSTILCFVALVYNLIHIFFQNSGFKEIIGH